MIQKEVISALVADKCREDADFVNRMQSDSKSTMNALCDSPFPADLNIQTVQNTSGLVHVPLPVYKDLPDVGDAISDEDLAAVSGGEIILFVGIITTIVVSGLIIAGAIGGAVAAAIKVKEFKAAQAADGLASGGDTI